MERTLRLALPILLVTLTAAHAAKQAAKAADEAVVAAPAPEETGE